MSPDVLLECPRMSFRDVLRVNVTERVWISPGINRVNTNNYDYIYKAVDRRRGPEDEPI